MELVNIKNIKLNEVNTVQGFVETIRNKKNIAFLVLKDISGKLQITLIKGNNQLLDETIDKITPQSVITVTGKVVSNENVKLNGIEMLPESIVIETIADSPIPLDDTSLIDQRLDYRWIDLRSDRNQLMFKVQTLLTQSMREWLLKQDFIEIHSPKLIAAASETGADVFEIDNYFGRKAYLAQSPQFYKQMAIASGFERVFETGPVFRAEKSRTSRHATEFTGFDLEFAHVNCKEDVMKVEQDMITYMLGKVKEKYGNEIKDLFGLEVIVPNKPFPVLDLANLFDQLEKEYGYTVPANEKDDLNSEGEKLVYRLAKEKYDSEFMFVVGYGAHNRAFYHMRDEHGIPQGFDLIWRGTEITTGALREHRYEVLKKQAAEKGLGKDIQFYLDFFKYGIPPHGGFGIGLDRITMLLLGIGIKESMFVFRGPDRLNP